MEKDWIFIKRENNFEEPYNDNTSVNRATGTREQVYAYIQDRIKYLAAFEETYLEASGCGNIDVETSIETDNKFETITGYVITNDMEISIEARPLEKLYKIKL